jgi:hypothetical protein
MTLRSCPYGFRIVGDCWGERRLVDAAAALAAYIACDPKADLDREAYLSAFAYGEDFRRQLEETGSVRGFDGECLTPFITFDIDRADNLDAALADARRLASVILQRYPALDESDMLLFFSGSKGFNVALPTFWNPAPSVTFHRATRHFAEHLARLAGVTIDPAVYVKTQPLRAPNSRHAKTGLHKRRLSFEELTGLSVEGICQLAKRPEPFELPTPAVRCEHAESDWRNAVEVVQRQVEVRAERRQSATNGEPCLNRLTLEFIRDGAAEGDRHRLLFSAAANLAAFGCPPALAHALLSEPGLDSGLSPSDVRRQIDCGLKYTEPIPCATPSRSAQSSAAFKPCALQKQLAALWNAPPPDAGDTWESEHDRRDAGKHDFLFGVSATGPYGAEGGRR